MKMNRNRHRNHSRFPFLLVTILTLFTFSVIAEQQTTTPTTLNSFIIAEVPLNQATPTTLPNLPPPTGEECCCDAEPIPIKYVINQEVTP